MFQLASLSHRHDRIIDWMILNPDKNQNDCAEFFNFTQGWISQIVNSDAFQAAYKERSAAFAKEVDASIRGSLGGLTRETIQRIREKVAADSASERLLGETLRTSLQALGYTPERSNGNGNGNGTQLHLHIDANSLAEARERAAALKSHMTPTKVELIGPPATTVNYEVIAKPPLAAVGPFDSDSPPPPAGVGPFDNGSASDSASDRNLEALLGPPATTVEYEVMQATPQVAVKALGNDDVVNSGINLANNYPDPEGILGLDS